MGIEFEWDQRKASSNLQKHGVSFDEASTVFGDRLACIFDDETHSVQEQREIIIGHSTRHRLLLVCFTEKAENVVRIISARSTTKREREDYEEHRDL